MEKEKTILQIEQKLHRIAVLSPYIHCVGFIILLIISNLKTNYCLGITQAFTLSFLLITFIVNRTYIRIGKQLEAIRVFSEAEAKKMKSEYFTKFFTPMFFWTACIIIALMQQK